MTTDHTEAPDAPNPQPGASSRRRLVKRKIWSVPATFRITCPAGLESALRIDVESAADVAVDRVTSGAVLATGPFDAVYDLLVRCRVADAVRVLVADLPAATLAMAFDRATRIPWRAWLPDACIVSVGVRSRASTLRDGATLTKTLVAAIRRDGIDVRVATDEGSDPVVVPDERAASPVQLDLRVEVHRDRAQVWLTCHARPLHHRVAGRWVTPGSLRETTAAAACLVGVPRNADLIVDPFCGSGTMIEEAASWVSGRPPGARRDPPLAPSPALSEARHRHAVRTALAAASTHEAVHVTCVASDVDPRAVRTTDHNLERLEGHGYVRVRTSTCPASAVDLRALRDEVSAGTPVLIAHPPYGRRSQVRRGDAPADVGDDEVWMRVVAQAAGWRFVVVHPRASRLAHLPGVTVTKVVQFRMRGLPNTIVVGHVSEAAPSTLPNP